MLKGSRRSSAISKSLRTAKLALGTTLHASGIAIAISQLPIFS